MTLALDNSTISLPSAGRTTTTLSAYLVNGAVFNVLDFAPPGVVINTGVNDASDAVAAAIAAAPDYATILFPAGGIYQFSNRTPTLTGRTGLTFDADGARIVLSGANRQALLLDGANAHIRWYGGQIDGSGLVADNQQAIGTVVTPPSGTITNDLLVSDVVISGVARGCYVDVGTLGDATDITYRRIMVDNVVGSASGTGYGLTLSGVWGAEIDGCRVNTAGRHAFYVSACRRVNLTGLRSTQHAGPQCLVIARSCDITGDGVAIDACAGNPISIEPHESDPTADTGRIQLRNVACVDTAVGMQDIRIGISSPGGTSSTMRDVLLDGVTVKRLVTETASGVEAIRIMNGENIQVRCVHAYLPAAMSGIGKTVIYIAADGGAAYTDRVTVEGARAYAPNLLSGTYLMVVEVNSAVCSGTARLTIRDNEGAAIGGAGGAAVAYDATKTNPQIEARFNRMRGALTGSSVLVAGTVTVSAPEIFSGDLVQLSHTVAGGTLGHLSLGTITSGTGFVINSSSVTDTSTVLWEIVH